MEKKVEESDGERDRVVKEGVEVVRSRREIFGEVVRLVVVE